MKNLLVALIFSLPFALTAQEAPKGVRFQNLPNWSAVIEKAKKENKFIFVDCFATWCGPCKNMDKFVYPLDSVGTLVNDHFIPVKVQMDSTVGDDDHTRIWHADARNIRERYKVKAYPTYLFFSPDGNIVHESIGFLPPISFMTLVRNAMDPQKQYFIIKDVFTQNKLPYSEMPSLAEIARAIGDTALARAAAKKSIDHLLAQDDSELYAPAIIIFIASFLESSQNKAFRFFQTYHEKIDSAMNQKGYSWNILDPIIEREEINSAIYVNGQPFQSNGVKPDWEKMYHKIKNKYDTGYAERTILWAKIKWLENKKEWAEYATNVIKRVEKYGPYVKIFPYSSISSTKDLQAWNYCAWEIFDYSHNRKELEKVLEWSKKVIDNDPRHNGGYIDTYANLLYKLGKPSEALSYEEKAVSVASPALVADLGKNLEKMKKGEPTWFIK